MKKYVVVLLGMVLLLGGCEKKSPQEINSSGSQELKIWTADNKDFFEALGREFSSALEQPIEIQVTVFESDAFLQKSLLHALAENKGPDIVFTDHDWLFHNRSKLIPLSNDEALSAEKYRQIFIEPAQNVFVQDGNIWGVPLSLEMLALFSNETALVEKVDREGEPPQTWEEFQSVVSALSQSDNSLDRFAFSGAALGRMDNVFWSGEVFENLLLQMTERIFSPDGKTVALADQTGVTADGKKVNFALSALRFFVSFARSSHSNFSWNELLAGAESEHKNFETFVRGETAMVFGKTDDYFRLRDLIRAYSSQEKASISEAEIRISPFPQFESDENKKKILAWMHALGVVRSSPRSDLAWQFLKFATSRENLLGFANTTLVLPAHRELILEMQGDPVFGPFARQAALVVVPLYPVPRSNLYTLFSESISRFHEKNQGIEEVLEFLQSSLEEELSQQRRLNTILSPASP